MLKVFMGNVRGQRCTEERLLNSKELGIYGFEKSQPPWTAKDANIKKWLLSRDQVQGAARKTASENELKGRL